MKSNRVISKVFALLLVMLMLMAAMPCVSAGEDVSDDGFKYSVKDGKAVVTGYEGELKKVEIPATIQDAVVTEVNSSAFAGCDFIEEIVIPSGVETIGYDAFRDCSALAKIVLPDSLVNVGRNAFQGTAYYRDASNWKDGALYIGTVLAMTESDDIGKEFTVKAGTKVLAEESFIYCNKLEKITLADSVVTVGNSAFSQCKNLKDIKFSAGIVNIGNFAFENCVSITTAVIPAGVAKIGSGAYYGCTGLKEVHFAGTQSKWETLVSVDDNEILAKATVHFESTGEISVADKKAEDKDSDTGNAGAHNSKGWVKYCAVAVAFAAAYVVVFVVRSKKVKSIVDTEDAIDAGSDTDEE